MKRNYCQDCKVMQTLIDKLLGGMFEIYEDRSMRCPHCHNIHLATIAKEKGLKPIIKMEI